MKNLLLNIQTRLSAQLTYLPMRDEERRAVYIIPDENELPDGTPFPCIGLRDGSASYTGHATTRDATMTVTIIAYVNLPKEESSMIGDGSEKGVLDMMADIKTALDNWIPYGFTCADLVSETQSQRLIKIDPEVSQEQWPFLQKKAATFRYWREEQIA